ncbi:MAG: redoxin domain-containing protein [Anaerolineales bacterium]|nr:redoxin domain-containing protein [Anaerolineales bacterium]
MIPSLREWHETYGDQGLVVIGNHYPEFSHERDLDNLTEAVKDLGISYPIAQDNDGKTWRAYQTRYWPTLILIGKQGNIRYTHIGEGAYNEIETAIQTLLAEPYP